jgi:1,3-beta-glucan synthase
MAIQRALHKVLISVFLSREFKHDETNRAWWTGRWYGRGLGLSALSQPAREFVVKIIELSLWSQDLLLGHFLLFMITPPIFVPYFDRLHSYCLCKWYFRFPYDGFLTPLPVWLRPSKQIRAPLYTFKQQRIRRRIVSYISQCHLFRLSNPFPGRNVRAPLCSDDCPNLRLGCLA